MDKICTICDFPVSRLTPEDMLTELVWRAQRGDGGWVVTLNLEMLARISREPDYGELIRQADIFTADGMPMVWASRWRRDAATCGIDARTTGVDLVHALLQMEQGPEFAIIGGADPRRTLAQYPGADERCRFLYDGMVDLSEEQIEDFAAQLRGQDVRVVFLALGVPKQDKLALLLREHHPQAIYLGIGGSFEMLAPGGKRAPQWMQKSGLEWLYRLTVDPVRLWKRYLLNYPRGAQFLIRDALRQKKV